MHYNGMNGMLFHPSFGYDDLLPKSAPQTNAVHMAYLPSACHITLHSLVQVIRGTVLYSKRLVSVLVLLTYLPFQLVLMSHVTS